MGLYFNILAAHIYCLYTVFIFAALRLTAMGVELYVDVVHTKSLSHYLTLILYSLHEKPLFVLFGPYLLL